MDKREILSKLIDMEVELGRKIGEADNIGIDIDNFIGGFSNRIREIIKEFSGGKNEVQKVLYENIEAYENNFSAKDELLDWILEEG
ncbi:hypothetical protein [Salipaludibacillus sp. CF4.18]|uniref:hypothetical protein n=1 Tax=Salipaludibacillus sp. CF4.18 TaxID=3373081 RepID=UPI003EE6017C